MTDKRFQRLCSKKFSFNNERNKHFIDMTRSNGGKQQQQQQKNTTIVWVQFLVFRFGERELDYMSNFVCAAENEPAHKKNAHRTQMRENIVR